MKKGQFLLLKINLLATQRPRLVLVPLSKVLHEMRAHVLELVRIVLGGGDALAVVILVQGVAAAGKIGVLHTVAVPGGEIRKRLIRLQWSSKTN